jgi:FAD/FMN-containing dehydrogenase
VNLQDQLKSIAGENALSTWTEPASLLELPLVIPGDEASCTELIRLAAKDGLAVIPIGNGQHASYLQAATRVDFAISTSALNQVEAYEPGDGTVTAGAGITIADLRDTVRAGGHRLTPDVPSPSKSTLGGVLAAGQSGFDRLRFGPVRNHVLGMRVLLGDGSTARTGGRLVKNVTGYDLHRLYTGSFGSLCLILEASLRLFPLQESELVCEGSSATLDAALQCVETARNLPLIWDTLKIAKRGERFTTLAALSGREQLLKSHAASVERCFEQLDQVQMHWGADSVPVRENARDRERSEGSPALRLQCRPSQLREQSETLLQGLYELGVSCEAMHVHPELATLELWLPASEADAKLEMLSELHQVATRHKLRVDWFGQESMLQPENGESPSTGLRLMKQLQNSLDPKAVFARGRFHRGL